MKWPSGTAHMNLSVRVASLLASIALALTLTGCVQADRSLQPPSADKTTTTRESVTSALNEEPSSSGMALVSPDFNPGEQVPGAVLCAGSTQLPEFRFDNVPAAARALALGLADYTDFEDPTLIWLAVNIPSDLEAFNHETTLNNETISYPKNDWGDVGFGSPCVEDISTDELTTRDLQWRLYALPNMLAVDTGDHGHDSWEEVAASAFERASLLMRYTPGGEAAQAATDELSAQVDEPNESS